MDYSISERAEIDKFYFKNNNCARVTARLFNNTHPNENVMDRSVRNVSLSLQMKLRRSLFWDMMH